MTITALGTSSLGATLTAAASASAAVTATVGLALPEVSAKLAGYTLLSVPSPSFNMGVQVGLTASALASALTELSALPGGIALAGTLTAAVAAQAAAQAAIRTLNPSLALKVDSALSGKAALDVQASSGVSGPNVNLALNAQMIATLGATLATLEGQASLAGGISASLGVGGLRVYRFDGDISTAGTELQAQIDADGIAGNFHFVVLLPTTPASWGALQATVRTS